MRNYLTISLFVLGLLGLGVLTAAEKEPTPKVDDRLLKAELNMLRRTVKSLRERNAKLTKEVKHLKGLCQKAGIDIRKSKGRATTQPKATTTRPKGQNSNTIVCKAIREYIATVDRIEKSNNTDIQKRRSWLEAVKKLDSILRGNPMTVSYTINDVTVDEKSKSAWLETSSARIRSSDSKVADIKLRHFYSSFRISATEEMAAKITKGSTLTVEGTSALNVDLSKPSAKQPCLYPLYSNRSRGLPGYKPISYVRSFGGYGNICLMIKDNCLVKLDGIPQKLK
ncbi:MAG: hypothetical protein KAV00_13500 [Phycisphaerae bacterium]|nr:hypothetical protein [Phycisphaerae bacterium]